MTVTIYHNPRCGKSRQTVSLLRERGIEPVIVEYLKTPPDAATLGDLLKKLGIPASALLRKGEEAYKTLKLGAETDEARLIAAMVAHPILIERPIVVAGDRAALGRPPESVLAIL